jgi:hypothetical protein
MTYDQLNQPPLAPAAHANSLGEGAGATFECLRCHAALKGRVERDREGAGTRARGEDSNSDDEGSDAELRGSEFRNNTRQMQKASTESESSQSVSHQNLPLGVSRTSQALMATQAGPPLRGVEAVACR